MTGSLGRLLQGLRTHGIPDLKLDLLPINIDHTSAKLHANRQVMNRLKALVRELQQQA
jgi:hypothetical protein